MPVFEESLTVKVSPEVAFDYLVDRSGRPRTPPDTVTTRTELDGLGATDS